jgi:tRNA dimethylallyltransferase
VGGRPRLAILGPTGTGKTALAAALSRRLPGALELVSVDAMAVYRELDRGTAKPTPPERVEAVWHMIDLVDPAEEFSVAAFQRQAQGCLAAIDERGRRAVLVGGTGLYQRALLDGLEFPGRFPEVAAALEVVADENGGLGRLYAKLSELDPRAARRIEPSNRRRIVRALEVTAGSGRPFSSYGPGLDAYPPTDATIIGLYLERHEIDKRLAERLDAQLEAGLLEEVRSLRERPGGLSRTARQAIAYRELLAHVEHSLPLTEARDQARRRLRSFARRQMAWFRRDPRVVWVRADRPDLVDVVVQALVERAPVPMPVGSS